jgi:uncharacterized protein
MSDLFDGMWALVTGASSGLGEEFARQLAARRANLILTARSRDKLDALARALAAEHEIQAEVVTADLSASNGAAELCAAVDARGHAVEHLISNAGYGAWGPFLENDVARATGQVRLNCEALVALTHHFLAPMVARGSGGIVHLASVASFQPAAYMAVYAATKAFVLSFSEAIGEEVRASGVRVMALCPGPVPTGFQAVAGAQISQAQRRAVLSAEETVRRGLRAYEHGKDVYVPGGINRLGTIGVKLLPRGMVVRTVGKMMRDRTPPA